MMLTILSVLAVLIILALASYAGWLLWRLHRQNQHLKAREAEFERSRQAHQDYLIDSIQIIARNMVSDDLNISEGSIRLKHLLDGLGLPDDERDQFKALDALYEKIRDFDTHEARQQLPPKERHAQDQARESHERDHRERVLTVAQTLTTYRFEGFGSADGSVPHQPR